MGFSEEQLELVERIGAIHDRSGVRPAAGRILGLLIVSAGQELSFDEISATLGLSKGATSTALSLLQSLDRVDYTTRTGDRKRYFKIRLEDWENQFIARGTKFLELRHVLAEAAQWQDEGSWGHERLTSMSEYLTFLKETIEVAHQEWVKQRGSI